MGGILLLMLPVSAEGFLPQDDAGWSILTPSTDSRVIYVSTSGSDLNSGLSADQPVRTIAHASTLLRNNSADWMLLNRGDIWEESFGSWMKGGRSAAEPMVLGAYGDPALPRPRLDTGTSDGITVWSQWADTFSNLVISGLHFNASDYGGTGQSIGIHWHRPGTNLLIEDVKVEGYTDNIVIMSVDSSRPFQNLQLRRSVIIDSYSMLSSGYRSQGIFTHNVSGILIEENFFDHNGFRSSVAGADPTIFNHNIYISENNSGLVVRNNILANAASHGLQARPGGIVERNLFLANSIGMDARHSDVYVAENVFLHGSDRQLWPDGWPRSWGVQMFNQEGAQLFRNLFAHSETGHPMLDMWGVDATDNVVYEWGNFTSEDNYPNALATIAMYDAMIGGDGSLDSFLNSARHLSRYNWDLNYTAEPAVQFFLESFGMTSGGDATGSGTVGMEDLIILANNWLQPGGWAQGDFNYDGFVDERDLYILARNWQDANGQRTGISFEHALYLLEGVSVPEPSALAAIAIALPLLLRRTGRKGS